MSKKMGIEGIGPKIILPSSLVIIAAYFITRTSPKFFRYLDDPTPLWVVIIPLLMFGLVFWIGSAVQLIIAWHKKQLITSWFYTIFLNPLYCAFIFFIIPALSLYLNSWLYILGSIVMYLAMRKYIKEEYSYLKKTFGKDYDEYVKRMVIKL